MNGNHPTGVEDYTAANLVLIFVNLIWIFGVIWSAWGLFPVLLLSLLLNHLITRIGFVRTQRAMMNAPRVASPNAGRDGA